VVLELPNTLGKQTSFMLVFSLTNSRTIIFQIHSICGDLALGRKEILGNRRGGFDAGGKNFVKKEMKL